jgi:hypothetical protein
VRIIDSPKTSPREVIAAMAELRAAAGLNQISVGPADGSGNAPKQRMRFGELTVEF